MGQGVESVQTECGQYRAVAWLCAQERVLSHVWLFAIPWTVVCLPGSSVHGIFQARVLEWVAVSSSRGSSWSRDWTWVSCISFIGRRILYHYTTWEACSLYKHLILLWDLNWKNWDFDFLCLLPAINSSQSFVISFIHWEVVEATIQQRPTSSFRRRQWHWW